jgi:hypothetical protein
MLDLALHIVIQKTADFKPGKSAASHESVG